MARCNNCGKFVQFDCDSEPEDQGFQVSVDHQDDPREVNGVKVIPVHLQVIGSVRMVNNCAECSTEMAEANLELEDTVEFLVPADQVSEDHQFDDSEFDVEIGDLTREDEYQTKDRRGKPIKNPRYQKHLYRAIVQYELSGFGVTQSGEISDAVSGSSFEDIQ